MIRGLIVALALMSVTEVLPFSFTQPTISQRYNNKLLVTLQSTVTDTATTTSTQSAVTSQPSILKDFDHHTNDRLPYSPGYSTWQWGATNNDDNSKTTHSINYLELGDPSKPAILLVHGFGASSYHWRYNIPELARKYHVYAIDLLGFGFSDKPIQDYDASVWKDQVVDFTQQVILNGEEDSTKKVSIAGNSLGGYTAMYACSDDRIKDSIAGCILLNAAGRFKDLEAEEKKDPNPIIEAVSAAIQRFVIACSFIYTKQPARIEQILRNVYPIDDSNVDSELVESIQTPALEDTAAEVFYRVITKNGSGPQAYVDDIIKELDCPTLLCWGESDPWIRPAAADKMEKLHREFHGEGKSGNKWIKRVSIDAGHCPHDEAPQAVNTAILEFVEEALVGV